MSDPVPLVEFLEARLSEREEAAREALNPPNAHTPKAEGYAVEFVWSRQLLLHGAFQSAWTMLGGPTPTEILADVAAKRAIIEDYVDHVGTYRANPTPFGEGQRFAFLVALARLAEAYADHPDYREEWRP